MLKIIDTMKHCIRYLRVNIYIYIYYITTKIHLLHYYQDYIEGHFD